MPSGRKKATAKDMVKARTRELEAINYRKAGFSYTKIAAVMNVNTETARQCVIRGLKYIEEQIAEEVLEMRRLELERLDEMWMGNWTLARKGNPAAIDRALRMMTKRAQLTPGLEVTPGLELTGKDGTPLTHASVDAGILIAKFEEMERARMEANTIDITPDPEPDELPQLPPKKAPTR